MPSLPWQLIPYSFLSAFPRHGRSWIHRLHFFSSWYTAPLPSPASNPREAVASVRNALMFRVLVTVASLLWWMHSARYSLYFVFCYVFIFIRSHMFIFGRSLGINRNACLLKGRKAECIPKPKHNRARLFSITRADWLIEHGAPKLRSWPHPIGAREPVQKKALLQPPATSCPPFPGLQLLRSMPKII